MIYKEIKGDLIKLAKEGKFDVIAHGCNCQCVMGAGIAPKMVKAFGCDKFQLEKFKYKGDIKKLGQIDYGIKIIKDKKLYVVNAYTQFMYGKNHENGDNKPLDYQALTLCMRKINTEFKGMHIGLPLIGCGLAGGVWDNTLIESDNKPNKDVRTIIIEELKDCDVTIIFY